MKRHKLLLTFLSSFPKHKIQIMQVTVKGDPHGAFQLVFLGPKGIRNTFSFISNDGGNSAVWTRFTSKNNSDGFFYACVSEMEGLWDGTSWIGRYLNTVTIKI